MLFTLHFFIYTRVVLFLIFFLVVISNSHSLYTLIMFCKSLSNNCLVLTNLRQKKDAVIM